MIDIFKDKIRTFFASGSISPSEKYSNVSPYTSFSQAGEDRVMGFILSYFMNKDFDVNLLYPKNITYIDVGSSHPIGMNNTYKFYCMGGRGILCDPNPKWKEISLQERPGDIFIQAGCSDKIGTSQYYMTDLEGLNTFCPDRIREMVNHEVAEIAEANLVTLTHLIETYLDCKAPDVISMDVEGFEINVLKGLNLDKYRPLMWCIEANWKSFQYGERNEVTNYLLSRDYIVVGNSSINIIFADRHHFDFNVRD